MVVHWQLRMHLTCPMLRQNHVDLDKRIGLSLKQYADAAAYRSYLDEELYHALVDPALAVFDQLAKVRTRIETRGLMCCRCTCGG